MNKSLSYIVVAVFMLFSELACSEKSSISEQISSRDSQALKGSKLNYEMKEIKEQKKDENSPLGYWDIDIAYPKLTGAKSGSSLEKINDSIFSLVNEYTCKGGGDKSFSSTIEFFNKKIFVMKYETMWMCSEMPHPDSDEGVVIYDLLTGETTSIEKYKSPELEAEVRSLVSGNVRKSRLIDFAECSNVHPYNVVYPQKNKVIFSYVSNDHGDAECDYEVGLDIPVAEKYLDGIQGMMSEN